VATNNRTRGLAEERFPVDASPRSYSKV